MKKKNYRLLSLPSALYVDNELNVTLIKEILGKIPKPSAFSKIIIQFINKTIPTNQEDRLDIICRNLHDSSFRHKWYEEMDTKKSDKQGWFTFYKSVYIWTKNDVSVLEQDESITTEIMFEHFENGHKREFLRAESLPIIIETAHKEKISPRKIALFLWSYSELAAWSSEKNAQFDINNISFALEVNEDLLTYLSNVQDLFNPPVGIKENILDKTINKVQKKVKASKSGQLNVDSKNDDNNNPELIGNDSSKVNKSINKPKKDKQALVEYINLKEKAESDRDNRKKYGTLDEVDLEEFKRLYNEENKSFSIYEERINDIVVKANNIIKKINKSEQLKKYNLDDNFFLLKNMTKEEILSWFLLNKPIIDKLFSIDNNIKDCIKKISKINNKVSISLNNAIISNFDELYFQHLSLNKEYEKQYTHIKNTEENIQELKRELSDCNSPIKSSTLSNISEEQIIDLLKYSRSHTNLLLLVPYFVRLLLEKCSGDNEPVKEIIISELLETLEHLLMEYGDEQFNAVVSLLNVPILQRIIEVSSGKLIRYLVAIIFRQTIRKNDELFFRDIFHYSNWKSQRIDISRNLIELLNIFYKYYTRYDGVHVFEHLISSINNVKSQDYDNNFVVETKSLSIRISEEKYKSSTSHFYGMKRCLCSKYYENVRLFIENNDVDKVEAELIIIKEKGIAEIIKDIFSSYKMKEFLGTEHKKNLQSFIKSINKELEKWIKRARSFKAVTNDNQVELSDVQEFKKLYKNLKHRSEDKGSVEWLDLYIYKTIEDYNVISDFSTFYFGEIPSIEHKDEHVLEHCNSNEFMIDFDSITPAYLRTWPAHLSGHVEYTDLLQDVISISLLNVHLRPKEIIKKYYDAGLYQEILESKLILLRLMDNEIDAMLAHSEIHYRAKINLYKSCESLENKITQCLDAEDNYNVIDIDEEFLLIFDSLEEIQEKIQNCTHNDKYNLDNINDEIEINERKFLDFQKLWYEKYNVNYEEAKENCNWLNSYNPEWKYTPENILINELKKKIQEIKVANAEKRFHIIKIKSIIKNNEYLSDNFINRLTDISNNIDHPGYWGNKCSDNLSEEIEFVFLTRDEWYRNLLNSLGRETANTLILPMDNAILTHLEKTIINKQLNKKYEFDIFAVFNNTELTNLSETTQYLKTHKYLTVESSVLQKIPTTSELSQSLTKVFEEDRQNDINFDIKPLIELIKKACDGNIIEKFGMNDILDCFAGDIDFECLSEKALSAWSYMDNEDAKEDILSIWLWAELVHGINNHGDLFEENVIIFLFYNPAGQLRSRIKNEDIISYWSLVSCQKGNDLQTKLSELLESLYKGKNKEELNSFNYILKNTNNVEISKLLWEIQTNNKKLTQSSRFHLLSVLYKLGYYQAIKELFKKYSSNEYRYLATLLQIHIGGSESEDEKHFQLIQKYSKIILDGNTPNPIKDFISSINTTDNVTEYKQKIDFLTMEKTDRPDIFRIVLVVRPAIEDPPLNLRIEMLSDEKLSDFIIYHEDEVSKVITKDEPLMGDYELEFLIQSKSAINLGRITFLLDGESVGKIKIKQQESYDYEDSLVQEYYDISSDLIKDIYNGESNLLSGKPALHDEFIGRRDEIENLKRSTSDKNQPLIILYGVRRLGKTSILYKLRDEACATNNSNSHILYIPVTVDDLAFKDSDKPFQEQLFRHIKMSIRSLLRKDKNVKLFFKKNNISSNDIMKIAKFKDDDKKLPFTEKMDIFVSELIKLINNSIQSIVFLFDEFDKFVEYYRDGYKIQIDNIMNQLRSIALDPNNSIGIVISGSDIMKIMFSDYKNAMYGSSVHINLQTLNNASNRKDAIELIQPTRLNGKRNFEHVIQQIIDFTGGHPLFMRVLSYMSAILSKQVVIRPSTVNKAVRTILSNDSTLYTGGIVDKNVFTAPLNAIALFEKHTDQKMARLLLALISKITTIESPKVQWVKVYEDEALEAIATRQEWVEIRNTLVEASLLEMDSKKYCSIKFPILAESLRIENKYETILETLVG